MLRTKQVDNSFEAGPKENRKLSEKIWSGRKNNDASCQFGACRKVFSSPLITLNTAGTQMFGKLIWFLVQCMVATSQRRQRLARACFAEINRFLIRSFLDYELVLFWCIINYWEYWDILVKTSRHVCSVRMALQEKPAPPCRHVCLLCTGPNDKNIE